jgi:hypothetical protein
MQTRPGQTFHKVSNSVAGKAIGCAMGSMILILKLVPGKRTYRVWCIR